MSPKCRHGLMAGAALSVGCLQAGEVKLPFPTIRWWPIRGQVLERTLKKWQELIPADHRADDLHVHAGFC